MKPGDLVKPAFRLYLLYRCPKKSADEAKTTDFIMEESAIGLVVACMQCSIADMALVLVEGTMGYVYGTNLQVIR